MKLSYVLEKSMGMAFVALMLLQIAAWASEPTKAAESGYGQNLRAAPTSAGLTKADLAWHALNTYGWDCSEVIDEGDPTNGGYFVITCSSGKKLRVYLREGKHPKITNMQGTYE